jgi:multiple sugar transport system substrate-binding protein
MSRRQILIFGGLVAVAVIAILILTGVIPGLRPTSERQGVALEVWGVFDDIRAFEAAFAAYSQLRPNVELRYRQFSPETYETDLLNALAAGRGPDIFMFHNTWLPKHGAKIVPAPADRLPLAEFQSLFPRVIEQDFAPDGRIYALPLYLDTLALLYNKDIFDNKGLALPPKTWAETIQYSNKIKTLGKNGVISRAGMAIGGSAKSINRASDLLAASMLQSGVEMVNRDFSRATFAREGERALAFYTQFANPKNSNYTWNDSLHYSLDAFAEGSVGMIFNYAYNLKTIREKNPFLRVGVAEMPQPSSNSRVDYPNYQGLAVASAGPTPEYAWDFVLFMTTRPEGIRGYLDSTKHPPALRALIDPLTNSPDERGVFARQALTARSWPQIDNIVVDRAFSEMIESVNTGRADTRRAAELAENELTTLMGRR